MSLNNFDYFKSFTAYGYFDIEDTWKQMLHLSLANPDVN